MWLVDMDWQEDGETNPDSEASVKPSTVLCIGLMTVNNTLKGKQDFLCPNSNQTLCSRHVSVLKVHIQMKTGISPQKEEFTKNGFQRQTAARSGHPVSATCSVSWPKPWSQLFTWFKQNRCCYLPASCFRSKGPTLICWLMSTTNELNYLPSSSASRTISVKTTTLAHLWVAVVFLIFILSHVWGMIQICFHVHLFIFLLVYQS